MKVKDFNLSKDALRRLYWMDWYFIMGRMQKLLVDIFLFPRVFSTDGYLDLTNLILVH